MVDEKAKLTLRESLSGFDTIHLHKLAQAALDRWNWDSGNGVDRLWYDVAQELLEERKVSGNDGDVTISMNPNNSGAVDVITMNSIGDLVFGTGNSGQVLLKDASIPNAMEHELFQVNANDELKLGYELQKAIASFVAQEINNQTTVDSCGRSIKQAVDSEIQIEAPNAVRNRL